MTSPPPATNCLDHIIHLSPPGRLHETVKQFEKLGFAVTPGGKHADGLTENALVVLSDGVYLELIAFIHHPDFYAPGSAERDSRENHWWAKKSSGWIDFCFLDLLNASTMEDKDSKDENGDSDASNRSSLMNLINSRYQSMEGRECPSYVSEIYGGRIRPDGIEMKWMVTFPPLEKRGVLPFFCRDLTSRVLRVPIDPLIYVEHPSTAMGVAFVRISCPETGLDDVLRRLSYAIGSVPEKTDGQSGIGYEWELVAPNAINGAKPRLILVPSTNTYTDREGIFEVGIFAKEVEGNKSNASNTVEGSLVWVKV
ncbi:hypothetical protein D9758_016036 [Tetrapyrgos nigripes]|uniref:Glyoxalase-like domain-containing protein n=1 Tax=Tetrapyrgos nigripes TaxID=182062 RepID=A0A8H5CBL0_9AGAR|nr:hypothetical protein D9758_016036 [Tetrapyrgos nigripes]